MAFRILVFCHRAGRTVSSGGVGTCGFVQNRPVADDTFSSGLGVHTVCYLASVVSGRENVASSAGSEIRVSNIRLVNAMVSSTPIEYIP